MCLYEAQIPGERLQDHWSSGSTSGSNYLSISWVMVSTNEFGILRFASFSDALTANKKEKKKFASEVLIANNKKKSVTFFFSIFTAGSNFCPYLR